MWTYRDYQQLLATLQKKGYSFRFFGDERKNSIYLRHDVDVSLERALQMAQFEKSIGVQSTYFVLVRSEAYNPFSPSALVLLQEIKSLGHEIGLHAFSQEKEGVLQEVALLEEGLQQKIACFSFHRPKTFALEVPGLINAYDPFYFSSEKYISDSNRNFRVGDPQKFVEEFRGERLQLLTHPIWWDEREKEAIEHLKNSQSIACKQFKFYLKNNIKCFNKFLL